ncbi:WD40 YVTN repeat-like-containing domain [Fusarium albosuccineum]|uniref:WD40 YVTN repeat-like-containing domain n=1 Tax=Fusarium albosuccineum TaxID=1237068 RepID=A0A8H4PFW6_9HYPO|nr:WD40 YVTN repeat-like-containing domain [Fusarium albosuccineum]
MAACAYRDASSYAPVIPSPLNPTNHGPENNCGAGRVVRRRRSRGSRRGPPGSHTLTQRLLRIKAAEAWRGHVLSAQVAQYESAAAAAAAAHAASKGSKSRSCCPPLPAIKSLGLSFSLTDAHRIANGLRLPDLSCLKTRRMLLAMGLMGVLPALKVRDMLRHAESL